MNGPTAQDDFEAPDNFPTPQEQNEKKDIEYIQNQRRMRIMNDPSQDQDPEVIKIRVEKNYTAGTARRIVQDRRKRAQRREAMLRGDAPPQMLTRPAHPSEIAKAQALLAAAGYAVPLQQPAPNKAAPPAFDPSATMLPRDAEPIETAHPIDQDASVTRSPAKAPKAAKK
jgi:hypothetical protein